MNEKTKQCLRYPDHVAWKNDGLSINAHAMFFFKTNWLTLTF